MRSILRLLLLTSITPSGDWRKAPSIEDLNESSSAMRAMDEAWQELQDEDSATQLVVEPIELPFEGLPEPK